MCVPEKEGVTPSSHSCGQNLSDAKSQSIPRAFGDFGLCQYGTAVLKKTFTTASI